VSIFISIWLGAGAVAFGVLLAAWQWVRLGRKARWGQPRLRIILQGRHGGPVRFGLGFVMYGALILAGRWTQFSAWYFAAFSAWAAIWIWDMAVWLRSPSER
jgi:hypothetical protein